MNKFMKKLWAKKESKKGFTLVELIVVLVILAILAAIMIPSLIGWIDKAKEKELVLTARNAELAAQTVLYENYVASGNTAITPVTSATTISGDDLAAIEKITGELKDVTLQWAYGKDGVIDQFIYTNTSKTATFDGVSWVIEDKTS